MCWPLGTTVLPQAIPETGAFPSRLASGQPVGPPPKRRFWQACTVIIDWPYNFAPVWHCHTRTLVSAIAIEPSQCAPTLPCTQSAVGLLPRSGGAWMQQHADQHCVSHHGSVASHTRQSANGVSFAVLRLARDIWPVQSAGYLPCSLVTQAQHQGWGLPCLL